MCQNLNLWRKIAVQNDDRVFVIFMADSKIIFNCNFIALLRSKTC